MTSGNAPRSPSHNKVTATITHVGRVGLLVDLNSQQQGFIHISELSKSTGQQSTERFKREVKYARKVSHRNVIRVHDILLKDGVCAISMEYFNSHGLEEVLDKVKCFETLDNGGFGSEYSGTFSISSAPPGLYEVHLTAVDPVSGGTALSVQEVRSGQP